MWMFMYAGSVCQSTIVFCTCPSALQHTTALNWCQTSAVLCGCFVQNPRMEQPLADVYFLVAMEHMVGEKMADMRLETALSKITAVNEVCWRWD